MRSLPASAIILLVEDDPVLRRRYRSALMAAGYTVVAVEDGVDALRRLEGKPAPSAVVLDLGLRTVSGYDVRREMQARPDTCHIPVVVVTDMDNADAQALGAHCVLRKPIVPETLVLALDECLRKRRSR